MTSRLEHTAALLMMGAFTLVACGPDVPEATPSRTEFQFPRGSVPSGAPAPVPFGVGSGQTGRSSYQAPPGALPPIIGGTLLVSQSGTVAVAADPDRDRIWVVDLEARSLNSEVTLEVGDEPARVIEVEPLRFFVALRRGGAIAVIGETDGPFQVVERWPVCAEPRGLDFDAKARHVHVACDGGELVTMDADTGELLWQRQLTPGLRDVVVRDDRILVSVFKTGWVYVLDDDSVVSIEKPRALARFSSRVAWRMIPHPDGENAVMLHQRALNQAAAYYMPAPPTDGFCNGELIHSTITSIGPSADENVAGMIDDAVLAVDVAISRDGRRLAVVAPGNASPRDQVVVLDDEVLTDDSQVGGCAQVVDRPITQGETVAVAFGAGGEVITQIREPAAIYVGTDGIELPGASREDAGHALFHRQAGQAIACASCHPEGGEDGLVWFGAGQRRTQSFRGGLLESAPFHWDGALADFEELVESVFVGRMAGETPPRADVRALTNWLGALPAPIPSVPDNQDLVTRGRRLFEGSARCDTCHSGTLFTNNQTVFVGTGSWQVPSLIGVSRRAPFMHTGCAETLKHRFTADDWCTGGDEHGFVSNLSERDIDSLVAYLETL